ncbi:TPA: DUF2281 domain-containing protein [Candidatus Acetothermia bacterium]|nr:DUF2281 domain-containing protein [Candidatus Acetothermia bacterium]
MPVEKETLLQELEALPEASLRKVLDFVRFLKAKDARVRPDTALLSEAVLAKDWLRPEEDEAWKDL